MIKRFFHAKNLKIWLVFIISLLIGIGALTFLPASIPIHFDAQGVPDNYGSKWTIFMAPTVTLALIILAEVLRELDPKANNYERFDKYYYHIHFAVSLIMLFAQIYTIAYIREWNINLNRILPLIMGSLFIFLGNMMPKFKHNYFVGIRTSWTLASEKVWYLTHRFSGKVYVIGGILIIINGLLVDTGLNLPFFLIMIVFLVALPILSSLYYFRKYEK